MTTIRNFCCNDFLRFSSVNLDHFTITGSIVGYFTCLVHCPDCFIVALAPGNRIMGYIVAGVKELGERWFGQITAVSVKPEYRRAPSYAMCLLVGVSNKPAIKFFTKFGFREYHGQKKMYTKEKVALDMRKILLEEGLW